MNQNNPIKVGIISLGCPRNLVDSEVLLGVLKKDGLEIVDIGDADVGIVNTCAFIDDAKEESISNILELIALKKESRMSAVVVAGCLPQRYGNALPDGLPEVDAFIGCDQILKVADIIKGIRLGDRSCEVSSKPSFIYSHKDPRVYITPSHYAYVKISEGCGNRCSFCTVPAIRGDYRSRPIESILEEADQLKGTSEINLIGQDTTLYGRDLYGKPAINELLRKLASFKDRRRWIRLLYTYPSHIDDEIIDIFAREKQICKYMDLPVQHANDRILKKMNRKMGRKDIAELIAKIRKRVPGVILRSSMIVGFPGESEEEFGELVDFIKEIRFDRLGVFTYSREEGTPAFNYKGQIDDKVKRERLETLMSVQSDIAREINEAYLGKTIEVLIDEKDGNAEDTYIGRTQGDAPEVDGEVFVKAKDLSPGDFVNVKIVDTLEYDLIGEQVLK